MCFLSGYDCLFVGSLCQYFAELLFVYSMNEIYLPYAFALYHLGNFFSIPNASLPIMS